MGQESQMMAVCGLDCGTCDIRLVPTDPEAAQRVVAWFHEMGWLEEGEGVAEDAGLPAADLLRRREAPRALRSV